MSKKRKERQKEEAAENTWFLLRRRIFLTSYLVFLGCCLAGCLGPWWEVTVWEDGKQPLFFDRIADYEDTNQSKTTTGPNYMRKHRVKHDLDEDDVDNPLAKMAAKKGYLYRMEKKESTFTPAVIAVLAICVAFLTASGNLVADTDIQIPTLLATLVICGVGIYVLQDLNEIKRILEEDQETIGEFIDTSQLEVGSSLSGDFKLKILWGGALFLSSSLVLLLNSLYLTFISFRTRKKKTT